MIWDRMQNSTGHTNIPGHRTVYPVTEAFACRIQIIKTPPGHRIMRTDDGSSFRHHSISLPPSFHILADLDDAPTKLMTQNDGVVHWPRVIRRPLMQVRTANSDIGDFDKHILGTNGWRIYFTDFDGPFFGGKVDNGCGFHGSTPLRHLCRWLSTTKTVRNALHCSIP